MADRRITDLQVQTQLTEDSWVATDNTTTGYRRFNLKSVSDAASAANTAATAAMAAKTAADAAKASADAAAADAADAATSAESRIDAAIDAISDISELAVPLMSSDTRGGAKLGHGLKVSDGSLHVGALAEESTGAVLGPLASVDAKGWAEQRTTTGKNLAAPLSSSVVHNGITVTPQSDGSVLLNGTKTGSGTVLITSTISVQAGVTYTASIGEAPSSIVDYGIGGYSASKTITPSADFSSGGIQIYINEGTTITNVRLYPQIELGSTATSYEPYTGGAPSPSPSYPQEIRVGKGRNLYDQQIYPLTQGKWLNANSNEIKNDTTNAATVDYVPCESFAGEVVSLNKAPGGVWPGVVFYDAQQSPIGKAHSLGSAGHPCSFYVPAEAKYLRFSTVSGTNEVQLSLGPNSLPYVPYGYIGLDAQGKNLVGDALEEIQVFNTHGTWSGNKYTDVGITATVHDDGSVTVNGTASVTFQLWLGNIYAKSGASYTLSDGGVGSANVFVRTSGPGKAVYTVSYTAKGSPVTFTATEDIELWCDIRVGSGTTVSNLTFYPQLEKGSTATAYEPYFHPTVPIPLPSTGFATSLPDGTADELTIDAAGHLIWTQRVGKVVYDGSSDEAWMYETIQSTQKNFYISVPDSCLSTVNLICSHIIPSSVAYSSSNGDGKCFISGGRNFNATIGNAINISTVADFKTWLSTHPVTVYYPLATPITHDLGYISLPEILGAATVSIKELDDLSVQYCLDGLLDESQRAQERKLDVRMTNIENTMHRLTEPSNSVVSGPLASVEAKGWAEQDSTTGKNLFTTETVDLTQDRTAYVYPTESLPAGTYTISCKYIGTASKVNIEVDSTPNITVSVTSAVQYVTITTETSVNRFYFFIGQDEWNNSKTATVSSIQLEAGSTATEYEPYTGGAPSPSPSYPQEIRVGKGRNLATVTQFAANASGGIDQPPSGTNTGLYVESGKTYTLSLKKASSGTINYYYLSDFSGVGTMSGSTAVMTFTATKTGYIYPYASTGQFTASSVVATEVQLELGSTPSPYVPYGYVGLEAQGKNLLPYVEGTFTNAGITVSSNGDGTYSLKGTATNNIAIQLPVTISSTAKVKMLSNYDTFSSSAGNVRLYYRANGSQTTQALSTSQELDLSQNTIFSIAFYVANGKTVNIDSIEIALYEVNNYVDAYTPYYHEIVPIPLPSTGFAASLPDGTADELTIDPAGKVQWVQRVGKVVLDGNEEATAQNNGTRIRVDHNAFVPAMKKNASNDSVPPILCSHFSAITPNQTWTGTLVGCSSDSGANVGLTVSDGTKAMTVSSWTTWLSTHPMTVYYPLATPVTHDLGYVDLPDISSECQVSIPELADFGCTAWVDDDGTIHALAKAFYERAHSEYESRLTALESAVATLTVNS